MPSAQLKMEIEGVQQVMGLLADMEKRVRERIAAKALREAAKPILTVAKARTPKRYGALRESLGVRVQKYQSGVVYAAIGARFGFKSKLREKLKAAGKRIEPAYYLHLVEYGTKPHAIGKGSLRVRRSTRVVNGKKVPAELGAGPQSGKRHPGSRAKPILRPAWDANKGSILGVVKRVVVSEINNELGKVLK